MKRKLLLSIFSTVYLSLIGAIDSFPQSPVHTNPSGEFPVLQLDKPLRFLNGNGLPLNISSDTYQVTVKSPATLQITSTSTGEVQNLQAMPLAHTESLTVPYSFLIEETEGQEQGHVHLVLLLPGGHALDAEGRREEIQTRGAGDLTKSAFIPAQRFIGVVMQQGRLTTDADWNEQEAIAPSALSKIHSDGTHSYGRIQLEHGRIQLDADARQSLRQKCRFCTKNH